MQWFSELKQNLVNPSKRKPDKSLGKVEKSNFISSKLNMSQHQRLQLYKAIDLAG